MPRRARPLEPKPIVDPELVPIFARRRELQEQIERLQSQIETENEAIRVFVAHHHNDGVLKVDADDLAIDSGHVCQASRPSPTGHCVYDDVNDPANDFCLYCGEPSERK